MVADSSIFIEFLRASDKTKTTLLQLPDKIGLYSPRAPEVIFVSFFLRPVGLIPTIIEFSE